MCGSECVCRVWEPWEVRGAPSWWGATSRCPTRENEPQRMMNSLHRTLHRSSVGKCARWLGQQPPVSAPTTQLIIPTNPPTPTACPQVPQQVRRLVPAPQPLADLRGGYDRAGGAGAVVPARGGVRCMGEQACESLKLSLALLLPTCHPALPCRRALHSHAAGRDGPGERDVLRRLGLGLHRLVRRRHAPPQLQVSAQGWLAGQGVVR